ncbi:MAG: hypothetical protein AAF206_02690 [Bacteroidota bacterium]
MYKQSIQTLFALLILSGLISACGNANQKAETATAEEPVVAESKITVTPLEGSPAFDGASLTLNAAAEGEEGSYDFDFSVENYELGAQTNASLGLANSGKGQHIHFIVDNGPYSAHYEPGFSTDKLADPGNHVVLAFLSRSYHESVKNLEAPATSYVITQFQTGEEKAEEADFEAPHMFYSRPKGTYKGDDTKKLLLDFFLLNVDLSEDGYKVRATINGEEFMLTKWQPYVIEGLEMGEVSIKLELMDAAGQNVPGPFNTVERTVTLAPAEA